MLLFPEQKIVYVATPGCASVALHKALFPLVEQQISWQALEIIRTGEGHVSLAEVEDDLLRVGIDVSEYFSFAVIRNPWDRAVSIAAKLYPDGFINDPEAAILAAMYSDDPSTRPQSEFVDGVDQLIRFENLIPELKALSLRFGIKLPSVIELDESERTRDYHQYYRNESVRKAVEQRYKNDVQELGYTYA